MPARAAARSLHAESTRIALALLGAGAIAAFVLCAPVAAPAQASASDIAGARAYVQADLALVLSARSHLRAAEAAPVKVLARVRRECPGAAAQSPQDAESTQMSNEVIGAMVLSAYQLDVPAIERFVARTARLRFGDAALGRTVHSYAADLRVLARLAPPALCADVRAWVAGRYTSLPPSTVSFDRRFMPAWVAVGMLPARLKRYLGAPERRVFARAQAIEVLITDAEARAVETWGQIMNELGLEP